MPINWEFVNELVGDLLYFKQMYHEVSADPASDHRYRVFLWGQYNQQKNTIEDIAQLLGTTPDSLLRASRARRKYTLKHHGQKFLTDIDRLYSGYIRMA